MSLFAGGGAVQESQFNHTDRFYQANGPLNGPWLARNPVIWGDTFVISGGVAKGNNTGNSCFSAWRGPQTNGAQLLMYDIATISSSLAHVAAFVGYSQTTYEAYGIVCASSGASLINVQPVYQNAVSAQTNLTIVQSISVPLPARLIVAYLPSTGTLWWDVYGLPAIVTHPFNPQQQTPDGGHKLVTGDNTDVVMQLNSDNHPNNMTVTQAMAHTYVGNP